MTGFSKYSRAFALGLSSLFAAGCRPPADPPVPAYPAADFKGAVVERTWRPHDWENFDRCDFLVEDWSTHARKDIVYFYPDADDACNGANRFIPGDVLNVHKPENATDPAATAWVAPSQATVTRVLP